MFSVLDFDKELFPSAASPRASATQPINKKANTRYLIVDSFTLAAPAGSSLSNINSLLKLFCHLRRMRTMFLKHARGRKFTELMANHVLGNENGIKSLSVMYQERVANKIRRHHRTSRPGFDRFLDARAVHLVDLLQQMQLDEGSFL